MFVSGLKLGLPPGEDDIFDKLQAKGLVDHKMTSLLKEMRAFRNILVHDYTHLNDVMVYDKLQNHLNDFTVFKNHILVILRESS